MDYYSIGWRDNNDGQGQAYHDATDRDNIPMTTQAKHTSVPWTTKRVNTSIGYCWKIGTPEFVNKPHGAICLYDDRTALNPLSSDEIEANARFMVRAVNNHDSLLEALQACLAFWDKPRPTFGGNAERAIELKGIQDQARAAIQSATGGKV